MLKRALLRLRSLLLRRRLEREMQEEMAEHLERATARLVAGGLSEEEARRRAHREFGNVLWLQEEARLARGTAWLDALVADARFALRQFARRPAMTITMFVVLAAGIGIASLLFSYVHSYAVLPPAGIALEDDLVRIRGSQTAGAFGRRYRTFSEEEFLEYRGLSAQFTAVAGWTDATVVLDAGAQRRGVEARSTFVTDNYFSVLGVRPLLGAGLPSNASADASMTAVAVIGHTVWDQLFGRDPHVIGSIVSVNGMPVTVVGVAPERFMGVSATSRFQLWMPLASRRLLVPATPAEFRAAGRLRPGVSARAANAATGVVAARIAANDAQLRELEPSTEVVALLSASGDPMFERDVRLMTFWVGLFAVLVLLVTCTNVSGLLMGLAAARRQEIAIRLSLGAARTRILRQLLTESAFLALGASVVSLGIVWLVLTAATRFIPGLPMQLGVTWPATVFTFAVALAVGVLFGLSPALHATRLGVASAMRDSHGMIAGSRARLQRALVVAQIAFTQPLIVLLAAVLVLVLGEFQPINRSVVADRVVTLTLTPASPTGGPSAAAAEARHALRLGMNRVRDRLHDTAGIEALAFRWTSARPLGAWRVHSDDAVEGTAADAVQLAATTADAGHFNVIGIPVLRGREFDGTEVSPVQVQVPVIIGADLARRLWAGADPVGRRLQAASDTTSDRRTLLVIGVVDDPIAEARKPGDEYRIYLPPDTMRPPAAFLIRAAGSAQFLIPTLRAVVREEVPGMVADVRTLADIEEEQRRAFRMITGGLMAAGLAALLLSAIALYAVVAFAVGQRSGEIAVRLAFGARAGQIVRRFVGDGLRLSVIGLAFGLPASLLGLYALSTFVTGFPQVALPPVTAMAAVGVILVAGVAAWIPARHAASVDPAVTLRRD